MQKHLTCLSARTFNVHMENGIDLLTRSPFEAVTRKDFLSVLIPQYRGKLSEPLAENDPIEKLEFTVSKQDGRAHLEMRAILNRETSDEEAQELNMAIETGTQEAMKNLLEKLPIAFTIETMLDHRFHKWDNELLADLFTILWGQEPENEQEEILRIDALIALHEVTTPQKLQGRTLAKAMQQTLMSTTPINASLHQRQLTSEIPGFDEEVAKIINKALDKEMTEPDGPTVFKKLFKKLLKRNGPGDWVTSFNSLMSGDADRNPIMFSYGTTAFYKEENDEPSTTDGQLVLRFLGVFEGEKIDATFRSKASLNKTLRERTQTLLETLIQDIEQRSANKPENQELALFAHWASVPLFTRLPFRSAGVDLQLSFVVDGQPLDEESQWANWLDGFFSQSVI